MTTKRGFSGIKAVPKGPPECRTEGFQVSSKFVDKAKWKLVLGYFEICSVRNVVKPWPVNSYGMLYELDYPLRQSIADIFEVSERNLEEAQSWREFLMGWKRIKQVEDRNREKEDEVLLENCQTTRTVQIFTRDRFAMGSKAKGSANFWFLRSERERRLNFGSMLEGLNGTLVLSENDFHSRNDPSSGRSSLEFKFDRRRMHWVQLALPPHHITDAVDAILGIP
uniref:Uncharacterized protein n=1 Tax=Vespula pensylvanica TaxID=30213 RepID=A0A834P2Y2_VESPE|nr:hypothetical protein H0235_008263 [Vespula pensylvanica]